jgi:hypothetical protein
MIFFSWIIHLCYSSSRNLFSSRWIFVCWKLLTNITVTNTLQWTESFVLTNFPALKWITIRSSYLSILNYCLASCQQFHITSFHEKLQLIGSNCFFGCESFNSITFRCSVISISYHCFTSCKQLKPNQSSWKTQSYRPDCRSERESLKLITISASVNSLSSNCFLKWKK